MQQKIIALGRFIQIPVENHEFSGKQWTRSLHGKLYEIHDPSAGDMQSSLPLQFWTRKSYESVDELVELARITTRHSVDDALGRSDMDYAAPLYHEVIEQIHQEFGDRACAFEVLIDNPKRNNSFDEITTVLYTRKFFTITQIAIGSTSAHKINAVTNACKVLGIQASIERTHADSHVNEQPVGLTEIYTGAMNRAHAVHKGDESICAIGIESGICEIGEQFIDIAVIVIINGKNPPVVTTSSGVIFPNDCVEIARDRGFETITVGSVIAEKLGGDAADPHKILTNKNVTRLDTLTDALIVAFKQL